MSQFNCFKNDSETTGSPPGKTIKDVEYNLDGFILTSYDGSEDEDVDVYFMTMFTLSRFRRDVMKLAVDEFPKEYALKTNALGPKCKFFSEEMELCILD